MFVRIFSYVIFISLTLLNVKFVHAEINSKQVKIDIETLASDEMQGRQVFTPSIDKAADYISQRFEQIGLNYLADLKSFKQTFPIYQVSAKSALININGKNIVDENYAFLSFHKNRSWSKTENFKIQFISDQDDFRKSIGEINQNNKDTLVILDPKHKTIFSRYKSFFSKSKSRFDINAGPSLILIVDSTNEVKSLKINLATTIEKKSLTNVVGILKGGHSTQHLPKQLNNENIIFSAHYDHLGVKNEDTSGSDKKSVSEKKEVDLIFNGADDDASGTTAVIALAEHYAKQTNRERDLIFVAFTAEEIGGFGSQYFSKQIDANNIIAMINIEMIGKASKFGIGELWMTGFERSNLANIMNLELESSGSKIEQDPYPKQQLFYRSDNATLARLGVPAHSFSTDEIDKDPHYHKTSDEVSSLNLNSMVSVIKKLSIATKPLVNGKEKPSRLDTSKVRKKGSFF